MRVVSWNLGGRKFKAAHDRAWHYIAAVDPDLALLQEVTAKLPAWVQQRVDEGRWTVVRRPAVNFGSLILAKSELGLVETPGDQPRLEYNSEVYLARGTVTLADGTPLIVGSVHTTVGEAKGDELFGYDPDELRRPTDRMEGKGPWRNDVAYRFFLDATLGSPFLVSGDWNCSPRLWDQFYPTAHEGEFFHRAEADGWATCYLKFHDDEGQTWFRNSNKPYQMDHAFCDSATLQSLRSCEIYTHPARDLGLSDHAPLAMEFVWRLPEEDV